MNDELTNRFEYDAKAPTDSVGACASAAQLLRDIISTNAEEVAASVHAALEAAPWLDKLDALDDHVAVMGTRMSAPSIWDQVRQRLPARVYRVLVIAPFFDQGFDFVRRIQADLDRPDIVIGLDPDTAHVDVSSIPTLSGVRFVDVRGQIPSTGRREGVTPSLHAKAMVFAAEDADFLVTGSANASGAAFLAPHRQRNTECVVLRRIDRGNEVLSELGLRALSHAPDVSEAEWKSMSIRLREDAQEADWDGADAAAILAVVDGDRFRIDGTSFASDTIVRALDADGTDVGRVSVVETGPPVILNPDVTAAKSAAFLIMKDDHRRRWAIVHRPISIAEHYSSDTRRALRQAIGSLGDDPAQLEVLLKLSEKVIFDDDGQIEKNDTRLRRRAGQKGDASTKNSSASSSTPALFRFSHARYGVAVWRKTDSAHSSSPSSMTASPWTVAASAWTNARPPSPSFRQSGERARCRSSRRRAGPVQWPDARRSRTTPRRPSSATACRALRPPAVPRRAVPARRRAPSATRRSRPRTQSGAVRGDHALPRSVGLRQRIPLLQRAT